MTQSVRIIGSYLSPYVRKVLVCLDLKGIDYVIDPIVPFMGNDDFSRMSPLRRIPVFIDGEITLSDSSVICQYLEDRYPEPALYPRDVIERARAPIAQHREVVAEMGAPLTAQSLGTSTPRRGLMQI